MKTDRVTKIVLVCLLMLAGGFSSLALDLNSYRAVYEKRLNAINDNYAVERTVVLKQYKAELDDLDLKLRKSGKLDGVLEVREEVKRFMEEQSLPFAEDVSENRMLADIQNLTLKVNEDLKSTRDLKIYELWKQYDAALDKHQRELTVRNKLQEAVAVRSERERVKESDLIKDACKSAVESVTKPAVKKTEPMGLLKKDLEIEGFDKAEASNSGLYTTYRGSRSGAFWAYSEKGEYVEWETAKVPSNIMARKVQFIWAGEQNTEQGQFALSFNGEHLFDLKFKKRGDLSECFSSGAALEFKSVNGGKGLFRLSVPLSMVDKGKKQTVRVESQSSAPVKCWFMLYGFDDLKDEFQKFR
ncbi:MAG: hypothetical protein PF904_07980 [Kiritimatiellae bacterium]|jgi:hypothetical protein|nr:hypothetical protein [Kiritimatiellia bacterium]